MKSLTKLEATAEFSAPEILLGSREYDTAIDMWSIGCIFALMISGENPFSTVVSMAAQLFQTNPQSGHSMSTFVLNNIFRTLGTPDESSWVGVSDLPNYPKGGEVHKIDELDVPTKVEEEGKDLLRYLVVEPKRFSGGEETFAIGLSLQKASFSVVELTTLYFDD
ncbi:cyclin-dependent kinase 2-like [Chenopodium quinoa]|uniref:cyclin-dependent kinase 2-like n=1 Tax=Chenopodium quinoa TaxID=63459 RepID=UPI000B7767D8|nr:cyclin-dependent kinase 2-like [Chenopodium quinoa]